ncbi:MAG: CpsD/CapB family tyrosine-protein kinase [Peptococcaceae bacterium]|nr:CpsD/CapB family tyrosine-protein kinase [Peptococcaceae bacterium]
MRELYALQNPKAPVVEAFRALRTNVSFAAADRTYRTLLVTSPTPGDGKSTVAANLGAVIAQAGKKVLLIDGDLRKPVLHQIFSVTNLLGLTNILVQGRKVSEAARETQISGLYFVPSGPIPPNPSELVASVRMAGLLEEAREQYDVVLLDSPPMVTVTDAALLSTRVDGVMLVVKAGVTRLDLVNDAIGQLRKASANFMGVVLNQVRVPSHDYHYYYYYGHRSKEAEIQF